MVPGGLPEALDWVVILSDAKVRRLKPQPQSCFVPFAWYTYVGRYQGTTY
jgi:hypothetical protein